jgi:hypothetical protein
MVSAADPLRPLSRFSRPDFTITLAHSTSLKLSYKGYVTLFAKLIHLAFINQTELAGSTKVLIQTHMNYTLSST